MELTPLRSFSTEAALDLYVASQETPRVADGIWHASDISGCQRQAIYKIRGVEPEPTTAKSRRVFFIGHRIHEIMQAAVAASPDVSQVYTEVKVFAPELNTGGAGDQVVIFKDGSAELQEFKSIKEWAFKKLIGPKEDHAEQIIPYMYALREFGGISDDGEVVPPLGDRLSQVRFTYIEKATFDTQEFVGDWDPEWEGKLFEKIANLEVYKNDSLSLPPRLPMNGKKKDWRCDWGWARCPFFDRCWNQDPKEILPDPDVY